eukprot:scaffold84868_cov44-Prasinocladus_malaysianus.AAC.2
MHSASDKSEPAPVGRCLCLQNLPQSHQRPSAGSQNGSLMTVQQTVPDYTLLMEKLTKDAVDCPHLRVQRLYIGLSNGVLGCFELWHKHLASALCIKS